MGWDTVPMSHRRGEAIRKVLVVDDSDVVLDVTRLKLEAAGFAVVTINSAFGFSALLSSERPDVILIDLAMPGISGDRLVQIARRRWSSHPPATAPASRSRGCPILLYSDRPAHELKTIAEKCGADGYVSKSKDFSMVIALLQKVLER